MILESSIKEYGEELISKFLQVREYNYIRCYPPVQPATDAPAGIPCGIRKLFVSVDLLEHSFPRRISSPSIDGRLSMFTPALPA